MLLQYQSVRKCVVYIGLTACVCWLAACSKSSGSGSGQVPQGTAYKKRAEVFQGMYTLITSKYVTNNILQLPAGLEMNAQSSGGAQTARLHLNYDAIDLGDNPKDVVLLHDMADIGDGSVRMILFADGHIESSTIWK